MNGSPRLPPRAKPDPHLKYFHESLRNIDEVKTVMINYIGKDGAYLIRKSFSKPGCLTVSVMHDNGIKHFNIAQTQREFYVQDVKFHSIEELVKYYSQHDVPNQEGIKHVRLTFPIYTQSLGSLPRGSSSSFKGLNGSTSSFSAVSSTSSFGRSVSTLPPTFSRTGSMNSDISTSSSGRRYKSVSEIEPASSSVNNPSNLPTETIPKHRKSFAAKISEKLHRSKSHQKDNSCTESDKTRRFRTASQSSVGDIRPPMPLPEIPSEGNSLSNEIPQYDHVRNVEQDHAPELIRNLKLSAGEEDNIDKCECGLSFEESELPRGWSMHISHEEATNGKLFFMGPNQETAWNLPLDVSLELSADQQDRIREYLNPTLHTEADSGAAVDVPSLPDSMPSSPPVFTAGPAPSIQKTSSPIIGDGEVQNGGTSFVHSVDTISIPGRHPVQHNSQSGSTESSGVCNLSYSMDPSMHNKE